MEESNFGFVVVKRIRTIYLLYVLLLAKFVYGGTHSSGRGDDYEHPLSRIAIHKTQLALHISASIEAFPNLLGLKV